MARSATKGSYQTCQRKCRFLKKTTQFYQDHREPNDILFFARTFEKWFIVVMKRTGTVLDLKKIIEKRIEVNAENLCCCVDEKFILDCYGVEQTEITENCVVHVMQGNPGTTTTCW